MMHLRILAATLTITLVSLFAASSAEALSINLTSGTDSITITDGGVGDDALLIPGFLLFTADVGVFDITVTAGLSEPFSGSTSAPSLFFKVAAVSSGAGTLTATLSDAPFGPSGTTATAGLAFVPAPSPLDALPAAIGTVSYITGYSATPVEFVVTDLLTGPQTTAGVDTGTLPSGAFPYSLTQQLTITHATSGVSSVEATLAVPDGGLALSLLGFALVGVEGLRRRFKK